MKNLNNLKVVGCISLLIIIGFFLVALSYESLLTTTTIQNSGTINASAGLSVNSTTIAWGTLNAGSNSSYSVTITNTRNTPLTLSMNTTSMPSYLTLSWNCEGYQLGIGNSVQAIFTLNSASNSTTGAFNFSINVNGSN